MTKISELPISKPRKSQYDLDYVITRLSSLNNDKYKEFGRNDLTEIILTLANEIQELKQLREKRKR